MPEEKATSRKNSGRQRVIPYDKFVALVQKVLGDYPNIRVTIRQIFYRFVSQGLLMSTQNSYKRFDKYLVEARDKGDIKWYLIADHTRYVYDLEKEIMNWQPAKEYVGDCFRGFLDCKSWYDLKFWDDQPVFLEVWVEKEALIKLVYDACQRRRVLNTAIRGQDSQTHVREAVERMRKRSQKTFILYIGDLDFHGNKIEESVQQRLKQYGGEHKLEGFTRIALTKEQTEEYNIPIFTDKKGRPKQEVDALKPDDLQRIIEEAIEQHIDMNVWEETEDFIESMKQEVGELVNKLPHIQEITDFLNKQEKKE